MSEHCQEVQVNYNEEVGKSLNDGSNFDGEGQSAEGYKKISDLTPADIKRLEFDSEDDVYAFYSCYAQINGFCVRRDDVRRESNNNIIMRNLVCNRAGLRSKKHMERNDRVREPKPITRTNCMARLRAEFDNHTRKWMIVDFEDTHNHEMTPSQYVHLMPAYRSISDGIKAQVDSLRLHGVRTCHIMGLIIGQKGGHADVGFCKKDLYNYIDQQKRAKINDGDAFAALSYLQAKADSDSFMFSKFTTTEEGRLDNLFWSDGVSRLDYHCFGDVVAFDTTYKKNKYNKPLVVFSGYNHHGETVIFACALVSDEKTETYKWVLETFCECMFGKHPKAVVTDGDGAMREAIRAVLPSSFHRLCAWHLHKNACDNVKNSRFLEDLNPLIYGNFSPDDFESRWKKTIDEHGVANNNWVKKVYDMKTMWASAYMRDKFFAGIRTTSICEGINSFIKRYVQNKNSLVDFMHNFERAVKEYRHNELISDFKSLYTDPLLTTPLHVYESWASQVFTRNKFCEVRKQIENVARLNLVERVEHGGDNTCFRMNKFGSPDTEFLVMYDKGGCNFACDCRLYESHGIPCAHIFCAMRHENIDSVPSSLICQRWTKKAKLDSMSSIDGNGDDSELSNLDMLRSGAISAACNKLYRAACKKPSLYSEFIADIESLIGKFEKRGGDALNLNNGSKVLDPTIVKTKGAPRKDRNTRKRRRCGHCQRHGHTKRKCPTLINRDQLHVLEEEEEVEGNDESSEQSDDTGTTNNGNAHMLGSKRHKNKKKRKNTEDPARCANTNDAVDGGNNSHINFPVTNANDELANGIMLAQDRHHQGGHIQMPSYNNIPVHHTNYNGYMTSNWQFHPQYPTQPAAMFHAHSYGGLHQGYPYHGYHNSFVSTLKEVERNAKDGIKNGKGG